jgi:hypothetical protein
MLSPSFATINSVPTLISRNPYDTLKLLRYFDSIEHPNERPYGTIRFLLNGVETVREKAVFVGFRQVQAKNETEVHLQASFYLKNQSGVAGSRIIEPLVIDITDIKIYQISHVPTKTPTYKKRELKAVPRASKPVTPKIRHRKAAVA